MLITLMLITFNIDFELAAKETHFGIRNVENALTERLLGNGLKWYRNFSKNISS